MKILNLLRIFKWMIRDLMINKKRKYIKEFGFKFYFQYDILSNLLGDNKQQLKNDIILSKLENDFLGYLRIKVANFRNSKDEYKAAMPRIIWNFWYQGNHNDIKIINMCMKSVVDNMPKDVKMITITKENLAEYLNLPTHILSKVESGKITITHLSDIIRMGLLSQYGGCWLDASSYITGDISYVFEKEYWSIKLNPLDKKHGVSLGRWVGGMQSANKGCIIHTLMYKLLCKYWEKYDVLMHYVLIDYFMELIYSNVIEAKDLIDHLKINNVGMWELLDVMNEPFSEVKYNKILSDTNIFKLTQKRDYEIIDCRGNLTMYGSLLEINT